MSRSLRKDPAILFVTATRIGDAVLSTGLLRHLVARFPAARFTIAAGPVAAPLFRGVPGLARLIAMPKRSLALHWLDLYARVALTRWDLVVDLRGSALAWLLAAADRRMAGKGPRDLHRVEHLARLFDLDPPPAPILWTLPEHEAAGEALVPAGTPVLGLAPTANWAGKTWAPDRFVELLRRLLAPGAPFAGARVAVFAAPHERQLAAPVMRAVPAGRLIDVTAERDLLTVAAALKRTRLVIAHDSGLMHMAATVGVPTLGLFGPSYPSLYAPWGEHTAIARTTLTREQLETGPGYDHRTTGSLMDSLSVDAVETAAMSLARRCLLAA